MGEGEPIQPVLDRVRGALGGGHRLWIIGGLPQAPQTPPRGPPPIPEGSMDESPYISAWSEQLSYLLAQQASWNGEADVQCPDPVSAIEGAHVKWFEGWK